jgi:DNA-binding response OmpR family regulator
MHNTLSGKKILIVKGSILVPLMLERALTERAAKPITATNIISAFSLIERERFDAAVIDKGLHNEAFDLCAELKSSDVPYVLAGAPHEQQRTAAQMSAACDIVAELAERLKRRGYTSDQAERYPAVRGVSSMALVDGVRF